MDYKFINVDIGTLTFAGLSVSIARKIAAIATIAIWVGVAVVFVMAGHKLDSDTWVETLALAMLVLSLLQYIAGKETIFSYVAEWLTRVTPLGVLYRHDKLIIDQARQQLLDIASHTEFERYLPYQKINPAIGTSENMRVIVIQKRGKLNTWVKETGNLKCLADLIYQIHLVEKLLYKDGLKTPKRVNHR
ncbi:hypothetical protein QL995_20945 [Pseudoalteromonas sp. APC 3358]|uniref:hypothetical protein n=1 Tax=Pseudoalteromonas sp. APC 3358 TaxID=3035176 RepID=UPI0025B2B776|nr:hypothetical protein [Pseudoalteromonas sp. APC 3358]MDN3385096.1 hypothetical protein [Pseudoalteromonas sp. APC 3358]